MYASVTFNTIDDIPNTNTGQLCKEQVPEFSSHDLVD